MASLVPFRVAYGQRCGIKQLQVGTKPQSKVGSCLMAVPIGEFHVGLTKYILLAQERSHVCLLAIQRTQTKAGDGRERNGGFNS